MTVGEMLDEFHRRPGTDRRCDPGREPGIVYGVNTRLEFIREEFRELEQALDANDVVSVADALADMVYVIYGLAWRCGIPLDEVVAEVHRSNMTKVPTVGDGKSLKGDSYSPPRISEILDKLKE